jgi:hypothetical protein
MRKLAFFDDKEARAGDPDVPAAYTVRLSVEVVPLDGSGGSSEVRELDLSGENQTALMEQLGPWLSAGRVTGAGPRSVPEVPRKVPMSQLGPPGAPNSPERRDWWTQLRLWSDSLGLVGKKDPGRPAWMGSNGTMSYPVNLVRGFALHERGLEAEAIAKVAEFRPGQAKAS